MRKFVVLAVIFCFCLPVLNAAQDDGNPQSVPANFSIAQISTRDSGSLTTTFVSNNGYAGNSFDIQPVIDITEISAVDVNWTGVGDTVQVSLYYKLGTCDGFETTPGAWTLLATGFGTGAGQDNPTYIDISGNGVSLDAGQLYGFLIYCDSYGSGTFRYTNGGPGVVYSNSDMDLTTYAGLASPIFSSTFPGRIWNGTVYYEYGQGAALKVTPKQVSAFFGGTFNFALDGTVDNAGRSYLLLGSVSGTTPGFNLPGGLHMDLNYDVFTSILLNLALGGGYGLVNDFIGKLDVDGKATASLVLPGHCELYEDVDAYFAWCTTGPFDFVSNTVTVTILGGVLPPEGYFYDDGTSEDALAWTAGGDQVWVHSFNSGVGDTINEVSTTFGINGTSYGAPNGTPCELYVWSDPNQDRAPYDAVLLDTETGVVANTNTNIFNHFVLGTPVAVTGWFFVGAWVYTASGYYTASMDESGSPYTTNDSWFCGAYIGSGLVWDPTNFNAGLNYEMSSIGFPYQWLLRANSP